MNDQPVLRRDTAHRVWGGVCAGLAQRLGVDPFVLRLAFIVGTLATDGLGFLIYLVLWIAIPSNVALRTRRRSPRSPAWLVVGAGLALVLGGIAIPQSRGLVAALVLLAAFTGIWLLVKHQQAQPAIAHPAPPPQFSSPAAPSPPTGEAASSPYVWQQPPFAEPVPGVPSAAFRRPVWRWVVAGTVFLWLGLAVLGAITPVSVTAYPAAALAMISLALIAHSRAQRQSYRRPRGLVPVGLFTALLTIALMLPAADTAPQPSGYRLVTSVEEIGSPTLPTGKHVIDLRQLSLDEDSEVDLSQDAGHLVLLLPEDANTIISYDVGMGQVVLPDQTHDGLDQQGDAHFEVPGARHTITVSLHLDLGKLEVQR